MGDYRFSIDQQPLVSALNAFTAVTGWQVGLPAELATACQLRAYVARCRRKRP